MTDEPDEPDEPDESDEPELGELFAALRQAPDDEGVEERCRELENALFGPRAAPRRFGRFIELGPIGRGGMGEVYEAYDPALDRKVAIKLLRRDMRRHHRRFEREAMALARLQHPNVVQIYEVGHIDERLFLAMELVEGQTLHAWQRQPHGWRDCVDVYLDAGRGLAAAHDAGLVHRDFKPANCIRDASGRVRVLDFGLARAAEAPRRTDHVRSEVVSSTDPPPTDDDPSARHGRPTETGSPVGTKAYMAPECLEAQASEKSDQYAFCVALYEALHGRRPTDDPSRHTAPSRPDASMPRWLQRALERGLHEDPAQRWPSMHALLAELERGRKQRRTWAGRVSLVAAALGGLAVGVVERCAGIDTLQAPPRSAELARAVEAPHDELEQARLLEAEGKYAQGLTLVSRVQAEALQVQGQLQLSAGDHEQAEQSLSYAFAEATKLGLVEIELEALSGLVYVLGIAGTQTEASLRLGERAQALLDASPEVDPVLAAEVLTSIAQVHTIRGEPELARSGYEAALAVLGDREHDGLLATVRPLEGLAQLERREGWLDRAVKLYRRAVEIRERWLGPRHPATAHSLIGLCGALSQQAATPGATEATEACQRAIDILAEQPLPDHGWLGHAHHVLGVALRKEGRLPEAEAELRRAIEAFTLDHEGGASHPELAEARKNRGHVLEALGRIPDAIEECQAVLDLLREEETTDANRLLQADALRSLGELERKDGRAKDAEATLCRALAIYEEELGPRDVKTAHTLRRLAAALVDQRRGTAADELLEQALSIYATDAQHSSPAAIAEIERLRADVRALQSEPDRLVRDRPPCE